MPKRMKPPGRIHQDDKFVVEGMSGDYLEELIGVVDDEENPILIFIKSSNSSWQQFFLDACLGYWENWGEMELEDEDVTLNYGIKFQLKGRMIEAIQCRQCRISISFTGGGELTLQHKNAKINSLSEVVFTESSP